MNNVIIERKNDNLYPEVDLMSCGLMMTIKNFLKGPSSLEAYMKVREEMLRTRKELRLAILNTAIELAKVDNLSDEKFRLLMLAFSQQ